MGNKTPTRQTKATRQAKRYPLRKVSKKRAIENREYLKLRKDFLSRRHLCEIYETNCSRIATQIHHTDHREGKRLLKIEDWLPACFNCHRFLHDHPAYARSAGFLK